MPAFVNIRTTNRDYVINLEHVQNCIFNALPSPKLIVDFVSDHDSSTSLVFLGKEAVRLHTFLTGLSHAVPEDVADVKEDQQADTGRNFTVGAG